MYIIPQVPGRVALFRKSICSDRRRQALIRRLRATE